LFTQNPQRNAIVTNMFRAIGYVIILVALSNFFSNAFVAAERAATESFKAIEVAAVSMQQQIQEN